MPWIPFYASDDDFRLILERLNSDPEIAIIVSAGEGRWLARRETPAMTDGKHVLWHIPGGPLPLLRADPFAEAGTVEDPFSGWKEQRPGADPSIPFFGSIPGIIELHKSVNGDVSSGALGLSSFGWLGNRYRVIGKGASPATQSWWRRMQSWVKQAATEKIPRGGHSNSPEIWAFPAARAQIDAGVPRDSNPRTSWPRPMRRGGSSNE